MTGSPVSVHDKDEWIKMLSEFVGKVYKKNKPIVGVCFGHQLIAKHFGGVVESNEKGWMIGSFSLNISKKLPWMKKKIMTTDLFHFNKERVTKLPKDAISFASSEIIHTMHILLEIIFSACKVILSNPSVQCISFLR